MSKKLIIISIAIGLAVVGMVFINFKTPKSMIDKTVVKELDLERYLGTWYEIARYDYRFERELAVLLRVKTAKTSAKRNKKRTLN